MVSRATSTPAAASAWRIAASSPSRPQYSLAVRGERERVADPMRDPIREVEPRGERLPRAHIRLGEVDDGDGTAEQGRQRARRSSQATAHVENAHARPEPGEPREALGRRLAPAVELVRRREVVDGEPRDVHAGRGERMEDRRLQPVASPVLARRPCLSHLAHSLIPGLSSRSSFEEATPPRSVAIVLCRLMSRSCAESDAEVGCDSRQTATADP